MEVNIMKTNCLRKLDRHSQERYITVIIGLKESISSLNGIEETNLEIRRTMGWLYNEQIEREYRLKVQNLENVINNYKHTLRVLEEKARLLM
ncbi:hypothetical protein COF68_04810 [Bacillus toyonensis]|uniref:hypothetical protein n=1 Tax=Bacillus toyonensis TaxID=155322 RepID=UPI000BFB6398|nr:hypothetical protein [Bacillus toyonensis]PHE64172.1 hypothetical protein COF68_04810 [Bacillus toyonensis]